MPKSFRLLVHSQLHEVLFSLLTAAELLQYRCLHSSCDDMILRYAGTQLQDVMGQSPDMLVPLDMICCEEDLYRASHRTMEATLVLLLEVSGQPIADLLATCSGGALTLSGCLFQGDYIPALKVLCDCIAPEWVQHLLYVDLAFTKHQITENVIKELLEIATALRFLSLRYSAASTDVLSLVAEACCRIEVLDISGMNCGDDSQLLRIA